MINNYLKHIAYICPECSEISETDFNIFEISDNRLLCKNSLCNEECVHILRTGDKLKFQIHCPVCDTVHHFSVSSSAFIFKDLFTLSCPESNIKIFFSGDNEKVDIAIEENNMTVSNMANLILSDSNNIDIFYEISDLLYKYLSEDKVFCSCGSYNISPEIDDGDIILICDDCGNEKTIIPDERSLNSLKHKGYIKL